MVNVQKIISEAFQLHQSGKIEEAVKLYMKLLAKQRNNAQLLYLLGTANLQSGQLKLCVDHLRKSTVISPNNPFAFNNLGLALRDLKQPVEALANYDMALALKPDFAEAHSNQGNALRDLKRPEEALASYDKALSYRPDYAEAHYNRGVALQDLLRFGEALASYDKALSYRPDYAEAHYNRGNALKDLKRLDEALASYDRALALKPDFAEAHGNRGNVLREIKRPNEALASYDRALALKPDFIEVHSNRGNALQELKRLNEALASYDRALALKPDYVEAYWNKSLLLMLMGRYLEGWELYEWRFNYEQLQHNYPSFPKPSWRGQADIRGRRLLIHGEQGYGDVIQFCRYLPQVRALGADIVFEVQHPLVPLASTLNCPMTVIAKGDALPEFDAYCPVMSLPYVFKTTVETIPAEIPYLFSDREKVKIWQERLGPGNLPRVGLTWSGNRDHKNDLNRSIWLKELLPLTDLPIEWHSLQKEYREPDLEVLEAHPEIRQHQDDLKDFSDAAALIECLDLVISVDTSTAHLAGALGKPVWVLLPFAPDYRWMLDREDTPWYPSARLFRQSKAGDWTSVIQSVREMLGTF